MAAEQLTLIDLVDGMCAGNDVFMRPLLVAKDIMTTDVKSLTLDHTVNACVKHMKDLKIRHIPLIDIPYDDSANPYFVGVISERDVMRLISPSIKKVGEQEIDKRALKQLSSQIVSRKPKTVSPDTPIDEVISILLDNRIDMVPVLSASELVGIITTYDLLKVFIEFNEVVAQLYQKLNESSQAGELASTETSDTKTLSMLMSQTAQDIMTKQVISLLPYDKLEMAIDLMQEHQCRHVPVTDEDGKLLGIISDRDVLRHLHYTGKREIGKQKKFREHLFKAEPDFVNLKMTLIKIMKLRVTYVLSSVSTCDAARTLQKLKRSCLPVVDEQKKLLGILTMTDLLRALLAIYGGKAKGR